jgi:hypothetical protein
MLPPGANAELVSSIPAGVWAGVVELVVEEDFSTEPPPPDPHATEVRRRPRASVRSTRLFYPKEGMWQTASNPRR